MLLYKKLLLMTFGTTLVYTAVYKPYVSSILLKPNTFSNPNDLRPLRKLQRPRPFIFKYWLLNTKREKKIFLLAFVRCF